MQRIFWDCPKPHSLLWTRNLDLPKTLKENLMAFLARLVLNLSLFTAKNFNFFILVTEFNFIFSLGLCSYWRISTSYAYNRFLPPENKASSSRKGLFFSHNTQLLSWFKDWVSVFSSLFRSLGNGFLSPILLAKITFIFTIGSVMLSIIFFFFFLITRYCPYYKA